MSFKKLFEFLGMMFVLGCMIITIRLLIVVVRLALVGTPLRYYFAIFNYLVLGFGSALPILIFIGSEHISKQKMRLRFILHFILTTVTVFGIQFYFDWRHPENLFFSYVSFVRMSVYFLAIYVVALLIFHRSQEKLAKQFNERIRQRKLEQSKKVEDIRKELEGNDVFSIRKEVKKDLWDTAIKKLLFFIFTLSCVITTVHMLIVILTRVSLGIVVHANLLYYVTLGFGSVLPILIFIDSEYLFRKHLRIRSALHFILTTVIVFGTHFYFAWRYPDNHFLSYLPFYRLMRILVYYLVIYFCIILTFRRSQKELAKQFNEQIQQRKLEQQLEIALVMKELDKK